MTVYRNFIGGIFVASNKLQDVADPATGNSVARVSLASRDDAIAAVEAADSTQEAWRRLPAIERGNALRCFADAIEARADKIGAALALESGKSHDDAKGEAIYGAELMRYHAEWARRIEGEVIPSDNPDETILLKREPIGVVACLIPFNFPIYTLIRKIAPALIAGNTVVVRPSNLTPTSAFEIAEAAIDAGLPAGAVNILTMSHEVAKVLCTHPSVGMITLTGSLNVGRVVLEYCKENIAKPSLELGGKTPVVIEPDADIAAVAKQLVNAKTNHCGQLCTAPERVYVHTSKHDELVQNLRSEFTARQFGNRAQNAQHMGPLASKAAQVNVHAMVIRAIEQGAVLETGGILPEGVGNFYPPTLLTNCRPDMEIVAEEVFGPVLTVLNYDTTDEALALANDHQFGLSSVLFTNKHSTVMKFADAIEAGELYVNRFPSDPYQGYHAGWKRSGIGGDDGKHGMLEFTQTRLVVLKH